MVTSATATAIQAIQRSGGKSAPSQAGAAGGGTVSPSSPPKTGENRGANLGSPPPSAKVAPARYRPRRRAAATPKTAPTRDALGRDPRSHQRSGKASPP